MFKQALTLPQCIKRPWVLHSKTKKSQQQIKIALVSEIIYMKRAKFLHLSPMPICKLQLIIIATLVATVNISII